MTFKRPKNVRIVDMCIYVDNNVYNDEKDESKIYQYIYHICYSLACKGKMFRDIEEYDDFALFAASNVYARLTSPKQYESEDNPKPLDKVKSVLNYIKATLYGMCVDYQQIYYKQIISNDGFIKADTDALKEELRQGIQSQCRTNVSAAWLSDLKILPNIVMKVVKNTPYKNDALMVHRLYLSCLMTLLQSVTLSADNEEKLRSRMNKGSYNSYMNKLYQIEKERSITLWKLDDSYSDYVYVLTNVCRRKIVEQLTSVIKSYEITDTMMSAMLCDKGEDRRDD